MEQKQTIKEMSDHLDWLNSELGEAKRKLMMRAEQIVEADTLIETIRYTDGLQVWAKDILDIRKEMVALHQELEDRTVAEA